MSARNSLWSGTTGCRVERHIGIATAFELGASVNPTLAARSRRQRLRERGRLSPAPFLVPPDPPTALLHLQRPAPAISPPPISPPATGGATRSELLVLVLELLLCLIDGALALRATRRRRPTGSGGRAGATRPPEQECSGSTIPCFDTADRLGRPVVSRLSPGPSHALQSADPVAAKP